MIVQKTLQFERRIERLPDLDQGFRVANLSIGGGRILLICDAKLAFCIGPFVFCR
jgi:hypothetical protein